MYILNKNAQDFYDLLSFVVKFCPWDFRTFSAETKNQSGCMRMCTKYHWLCHVHTYCMCVCCARRAKNRWSCSSQWLPNGRDNNWHSPDCKLAKKANGKQKDTAAGVKVGTVGYILVRLYPDSLQFMDNHWYGILSPEIVLFVCLFAT